MKAQWKSSQIQIEMNKALENMGGIEDTTQVFERAQSKIRNANSEQMARGEMAQPRVDQRCGFELAAGPFHPAPFARC